MYSFDCNIYRKINLRKIRFVSEINRYFETFTGIWTCLVTWSNQKDFSEVLVMYLSTLLFITYIYLWEIFNFVIMEHGNQWALFTVRWKIWPRESLKFSYGNELFCSSRSLGWLKKMHLQIQILLLEENNYSPVYVLFLTINFLPSSRTTGTRRNWVSSCTKSIDDDCFRKSHCGICPLFPKWNYY